MSVIARVHNSMVQKKKYFEAYLQKGNCMNLTLSLTTGPIPKPFPHVKSIKTILFANRIELKRTELTYAFAQYNTVVVQYIKPKNYWNRI